MRAGVSGPLASIKLLEHKSLLWRMHFSRMPAMVDCSCLLLNRSQAQRLLYERQIISSVG